MKIVKFVLRSLITLLLVECALSQAVLVGDPENPQYRDAHKQYMKTSGVILDLCVYEREFQRSEQKPQEGQDNPPWTSGTLITRAVVVGVHKGNVKIGTKIEIVETVIDPPEFLKKFRSVVEGELLTYFYYGEELPKPKNELHMVDHNQMYFERDKDEDVKAFLKSESEGSDKPQPEAKGRAR